jgi:HAD superfamily hydrolase (TIGR01549 family)
MKNSLKAILFDLDGTLLDSNMAEFLPHYLQRLSTRMAHLMPPKEFIARLMQATDVMAANDGRATNEEVFAAAFYPLIGRSRAEMEPLFRDFYLQDFPALKQYTRRKPEARPVVQTAFDLGYDVAIATQPLFPETAIRHRMAWADVDGFPYRLVTTYENSRFCKPNPRYFEEIARQLDHPTEACLMIGDEQLDMAAARAGCPTFFVAGPAASLDLDAPEPTYRGTLADVATLLTG